LEVGSRLPETAPCIVGVLGSTSEYLVAEPVEHQADHEAEAWTVLCGHLLEARRNSHKPAQ